MYTAYFDESGHSASEEFVAIAAYIADDATWAKFDTAWNATLAQHGVRYMHSFDLSNRTRIFEGWSSEQQVALSRDLLDVFIESGYIVAAGAAMSTRDYQRLSAEQQERLRNPFFPLFQEVIYSASLEALFEQSGEGVRMIFSQQDEFRKEATKLYEVMKQSFRRPELLGTLEFQNMRTVPGLQAADVLAYELCKYYKIRSKNPAKPMRPSFRRLLFQQRAYKTRRIRYVSYFHLRLQLMPWWVFKPVMTLVTLALAVPGYFFDGVFGWALGDPVLPTQDRQLLRRLER